MTGAMEVPGAGTAPITWRLHLSSPPERVYALLATDAGRASFWAESAVEEAGAISFEFPGGLRWVGEVLTRDPPRCLAVRYFGGSTVEIRLEPDGSGGTDLTLNDEGVRAADILETTAGWVSVLMALKGTADFGIDLRSHDESRTWEQGYCDN